MQLRGNAGSEFQILDCAHYLPVGEYPSLCYVEENVVLLNRYSHSMLDSRRHPVTGQQLSREEQVYWWKVILGQSQYEALQARIEKEK
jgi:hypothetical protein